ncbi:hypothetical protein LshimejAT787_1701000 [Lyophyllum shimeji]|uniref:Uncharacterized protein n=1 Tax=Lyophyllum shimeji TaxID=47721 RepID=A0A9P3PYP8_LYOSH|nr:hypothetical protein LshimejAT787_1701000 [Lyophyllum shimeji]
MPLNFQRAKDVHIQNSLIYDIVGVNNVQCSSSHVSNCGNTKIDTTTNSNNDSSITSDQRGDDFSFASSEWPFTPRVRKTCDQDTYRSPAPNDLLREPPRRPRTSAEAACDRRPDYPHRACTCVPEPHQPPGQHAAKATTSRSASNPLLPQTTRPGPHLKSNNPFRKQLDSGLVQASSSQQSEIRSVVEMCRLVHSDDGDRKAVTRDQVDPQHEILVV